MRAAYQNTREHNPRTHPTGGHATVRQNQQYEHTRHTPQGHTVHARVHSPVLKPPHHTTPAPTPQGARPGRRERNTTPDKGPGGPGTQQHAPHHHQAPEGTRPDSFPASKGRHPARRPGKGSIPSSARDSAPTKLRRKEVIQPHLPVRLPCYDLVPITSLTLDGSPHKG